MHGVGTAKYIDGRMYEGDFKKGKFSGKGILRNPDESMHQGEFLNGKKHGKVISFPVEGITMVHEWKNDKIVRLIVEDEDEE